MTGQLTVTQKIQYVLCT